MARRRPGAAAVFVRPCAPLRGRSAPRRRSRRCQRRLCARPRRGNRVLRRDGPDRREDGVDPDGVRVHRDARPPRVDRRDAGCTRRGRVGRRDRRAERRGRADGSLRVLRRARDERSAGLCRSAHLAASAHGACAGGDCPAGDRSDSRGHAVTGRSAGGADANRAPNGRRRPRGCRSTRCAGGFDRADGSVDHVAAEHGHPCARRTRRVGSRDYGPRATSTRWLGIVEHSWSASAGQAGGAGRGAQAQRLCGYWSRARGEPGISPSAGGGPIATASAPPTANSFDCQDERTRRRARLATSCGRACCADRRSRAHARVPPAVLRKGGSYHGHSPTGAGHCPNSKREKRSWWRRPGRTQLGRGLWATWSASQCPRTSSRGTTG